MHDDALKVASETAAVAAFVVDDVDFLRLTALRSSASLPELMFPLADIEDVAAKALCIRMSSGHVFAL